MASSVAVTDALPFVDEPLDTGDDNEGRSDLTRCSCNTTVQDSNLNYDMSGDKILIIFNHYKYKKTRHYKYVPSNRRGTWQDVKSLENTFRSLGFVVIAHHDWKYRDIVSYISNVCQKDHSRTSCLAVAIMTHGHGTRVCAADRLYPVAELTEMIRTAPSLIGKPKLFFIQACRGGHTKPHRKKADEEIHIPIDADSLVLYSSYEDYVSYRGCGTWMMQALCEVINTHHHTLDLLSMSTLIQQIVANKSTEFFAHKQMPVTEFNLMKFLKL